MITSRVPVASFSTAGTSGFWILCRDLLRNRKVTREVGGLLWWLSDDLVILGGLPLILVSANFTGQVFGGFFQHFTDPKMGKIGVIC